MEVDRVRKVADMIEAHPEHFNMSLYFGSAGCALYANYLQASKVVSEVDLFSCGTTGCIAGWATWLWAAEIDSDTDIICNAARILDLDEGVAALLFSPSTGACDTPDKAAAHLRSMADDYEAAGA